jgi:restriction endonuclease S subunit
LNLPIIKDRDVLFAAMGVGSLGKTAIRYSFENEGKFTVDSTLRIMKQKESSKISPETLLVYLNSQIAQELIYQNIVGSSGVISIYDSYTKELPIPLITSSINNKITELVHQSHEARKKAKELLEEAKRRVEEMVEGN